jgi:hypothetical protein
MALVFAVLCAQQAALGAHAAREMARFHLSQEQIKVYRDERKQYFLAALFLIVVSFVLLNIA